MITYTSRKRSHATFEEDLSAHQPLPTPPPSSSPKALQPTSGNILKLPTPSEASTQGGLTRLKVYQAEARDLSSAPTSSDIPSSPPRPTQMRSITTSQTTTSSMHTKMQPPQKRQKLTQLTIDLGGPTHTRCKVCRMEYIPSSAEDRTLHASFHKASVGGVDLCASLRGAAYQGSGAGREVWRGLGISRGIAFGKMKEREGLQDRILEVCRTDRIAVRRAALRVLEVVERELGALATGEEVLWGTMDEMEDEKKREEKHTRQHSRFKVYLYINTATKKCTGLLLAQRIRKAKSRTFLQAEHDSEPSPSKTCTASMGVSRIWVSREYQKCGIATQLLEAAKSNFLLGRGLGKGEVAFSQPTDMGREFIKRWHGDTAEKWLLYDEWNGLDDKELLLGRLEEGR